MPDGGLGDGDRILAPDAECRTEGLQFGGPAAVTGMIRAALSAGRDTSPVRVDTAWVQQAAARVLAQVQARRSTWQVWHVRAEADRQIRPATLTATDIGTVLDLVVDAALDASVRLSPAGDGLTEPALLRRSDGTSMYTLAGAAQFTSREILAAEQRIVAAAGLAGRHAATEQAVTVTLLEQAANHAPRCRNISSETSANPIRMPMVHAISTQILARG